jgi:serine/threonine-protein phosphatase PGAM5
MTGTPGTHDSHGRGATRRRLLARGLLILVTMLACAAVGARAAISVWAADPPRPAPRPPAPDSPRARGVHYVYLIRHGMYDRDSLSDDRAGNGLNALGREQAQMVGARLAALPVKMHALVTSDFARARETAGIIGRALRMTPAVDSLLHECAPTRDRADLMGNRPREGVAQCDSNLAAAWAKYMRPSPEADTHDVLVCHGNVTRWFVSRALGTDTRHWTQMDIANCSISILAVRSDGTTRLVMFSDVGHIPVDKQTWTGRGAGWGSAGAR